ncbi:MAG TPA: alpha/beta hydrolase, partial [Patescibacteria group bacterium]|nr:alpha/beta hydrolase [Patescibacteria group bacterium]
MLNCKISKLIFRIILLVTILIPTTSALFANTLDSWVDSKAYKPYPILFLHGFARSDYHAWSVAIEELGQWFSKYAQIGTYLETLDFRDPNGSIDTYPNGDNGWADKVNLAVSDLLTAIKYGSYANKVNLVCHSMGGLAAREYLSNNKYPRTYVDKAILIG